MKLTIFAATGGIGRQLLEQAIAAGHDVTAVARNPQNLSPIPARAVAADLASADPAVLQPALAGADAVLSALGPRTKADAGVAARGTKVITQAMRAAGVRRVIVVSAAPIGTVPSPGRPHPPRLTSKPVTGRYRTAFGQNLRRGLFVSRADVAHYMLSILDQPGTFRQTIGIAN